MSRRTLMKIVRTFHPPRAIGGGMHAYDKREEPLPALPNEIREISCNGRKIKISVSPGQFVNEKRMCKRYNNKIAEDLKAEISKNKSRKQ